MIVNVVGVLRMCRKCGWIGSLSCFAKHPRGKFGRRHECLACRREFDRISQAKRRSTPEGKAASNAASKRWRESPQGQEYLASDKHKENQRAYSKKYRAKPGMKEQRREYSSRPDVKASREERRAELKSTPEGAAKIAQQEKKWRQSPKGKANLRKKKSRRRGWEIPVEYVPGDVCEYGGVCEGPMEVDHIISVGFAEFVSEELRSDLRMFATCCKSCNSSKGNRLPNSEKHLRQVSEVLGYDILLADWCPDLWSPPDSLR